MMSTSSPSQVCKQTKPGLEVQTAVLYLQTAAIFKAAVKARRVHFIYSELLVFFLPFDARLSSFSFSLVSITHYECSRHDLNFKQTI